MNLGDGRDRVSIVLFADNFWLVATSPEILASMTTAWLKCLKEWAFEVPLDQCTWCTTLSDSISGKVVCNGETVKRASRDEGFKALGCEISFNTYFVVELDNRIAKFWGWFWGYQQFLLNPNIGFKRRLHLLELLMSASMMWFAGYWNLRQTEVSRIKRVQE